MLNYAIIKKLKKSMSSEFAVRRNQNEQGENELKKREVRLTRISISIVLIFIICHVPRCIINILELSLGGLHDKVRTVLAPLQATLDYWPPS